MKIIFASNNKHKLSEVKDRFVTGFLLYGLEEVGIIEDIPENGFTLNENALIKAQFVWQKAKLSCFADDSGLEIEALNNQPGVYSARYAGPQKNDEDNMQKVLQDLKGKTNRNAQFRTVIALIFDGNEHIFEGIIQGHITEQKRGSNGFGYDPIFVPNGHSKTFAEMTRDEKNSISHRAIAVNKLVDFLNNLPQ